MAFSANFALVLSMSGAKRRSGYRKGVEASLLHGDVEPEPGQRLALLLKSRGSNIMEVRVEPALPGGDCEIALALLPARFHKAIWVKRGDALLLAEPSAAASEPSTHISAANIGAGPRFLIHTVIYPDQLRALRASGRWPASLDVADVAAATAEATAGALSPHDAISAGKWRAKGGGTISSGGGGAALAAALAAQARADQDEEEEKEEDALDSDEIGDDFNDSSAGVTSHDNGGRGLPPAYDDYPASSDDESKNVAAEVPPR